MNKHLPTRDDVLRQFEQRVAAGPLFSAVRIAPVAPPDDDIASESATAAADQVERLMQHYESQSSSGQPTAIGFDSRLAEAAAAASEERPAVSGVNRERRSMGGVASSLEISRTGHLIEVAGMDLAGFKSNPVLLASHSSVNCDGLPLVIGMVGRIWKTDNNSVLRFANAVFDDDAIAETWFQKVAAGFVRMLSVGIRPVEWEVFEAKIGRGQAAETRVAVRIIRSELLELSVVPIGANRGSMVGQEGELSDLRADLATAQASIQRLQEALDALTRQSESSTIDKAAERLGRVAALF